REGYATSSTSGQNRDVDRVGEQAGGAAEVEDLQARRTGIEISEAAPVRGKTNLASIGDPRHADGLHPVHTYPLWRHQDPEVGICPPLLAEHPQLPPIVVSRT